MCAKKIEIIDPNRYKNMVKSKLHSIEEKKYYKVQKLKEEPVDETLKQLLDENNVEGAIQYKQDLLLKGKMNINNKPKK